MGDHSSMSISANSPSDETLNRGPLGLLLWRQYEFPFGINVVQFSMFNFQIFFQPSLALVSQNDPADPLSNLNISQTNRNLPKKF